MWHLDSVTSNGLKVRHSQILNYTLFHDYRFSYHYQRFLTTRGRKLIKVFSALPLSPLMTPLPLLRLYKYGLVMSAIWILYDRGQFISPNCSIVSSYNQPLLPVLLRMPCAKNINVFLWLIQSIKQFYHEEFMQSFTKNWFHKVKTHSN